MQGSRFNQPMHGTMLEMSKHKHTCAPTAVDNLHPSHSVGTYGFARTSSLYVRDGTKLMVVFLNFISLTMCSRKKKAQLKKKMLCTTSVNNRFRRAGWGGQRSLHIGNTLVRTMNIRCRRVGILTFLLNWSWRLNEGETSSLWCCWLCN